MYEDSERMLRTAFNVGMDVVGELFSRFYIAIDVVDNLFDSRDLIINAVCDLLDRLYINIHVVLDLQISRRHHQILLFRQHVQSFKRIIHVLLSH